MNYKDIQTFMRLKIVCNSVFLIMLVPLYAHTEPLPLMESFSSNAGVLSFECSQKFADQFLNKPMITLTFDNNPEISSLDESIQRAPFHMSLAPLVWLSNQTYIVDTMDHDLYYSLNEVREVFKRFYPSLAWSGTLLAKNLKKNQPLSQVNSSTTILFSGGLDSTATSFSHLDKKQHLVTLRGVDIKLGNEAAWQGALKHCSEFAHSYQHELFTVSFDLQKHLKREKLNNICPEIKSWWAYTMGSLSHVAVALPLAYLLGDHSLHIAASNTRSCPRPYGNHPLIDNSLLICGIQTVHDGADLCRTRKIQHIVTQAEKYTLKLPHLRVCQQSKVGQNCCKCIDKCILTMNNILAAGYNPSDFGFAEDINNVIEISKKYFSNHQKFSWGTWFEWTSIQKAIRLRIIKNNVTHPVKSIHNYLMWFSELPFTLNTKAHETKEQCEQYWHYLWDAAYVTQQKNNALLDYPPYT